MPRKYVSRICLSQMHIFILQKVACDISHLTFDPVTLTLGQL